MKTQSSIRRTGMGIAFFATALLVGTSVLAQTATASPVDRMTPTILSASWGTDNGAGCPNGIKGLDNLPVTFNWFIDPASIDPTEFLVIKSDGTAVHPVCALQFPPNEPNEAQTVNLIGNFGDAVNGPTPYQVRVLPGLRGKAPGAKNYRAIGALPDKKVDNLSGGPFMVDAWRLTPALMANDPNACTVGSTFVRVVWSNGLTAYPTGAEVSDGVAASYRAVFKLPNGTTRHLTPIALADLYDHATTFNSDNMHDLCLPALPRGSVLTAVSIGPGVIQDPNGDANLSQKLFVRSAH